ncbi:MAG: flavin oxidoreductase/NADH oxidase [Ruminococcaceae bacterium]|nr:flavin oxidoreductase/NADH oxidase [Oscillospiraceae bacterium]
MEHREFHYTSINDVQAEAAALGVALPLSENTAVLKKPLAVGGVTLPNRLAIQPMEGCDGTADGAPDELTLRRYRRFAASGAALIWAEATAVVPEGRANPRQLMLTADNLDAYKFMVEEMREICLRENGFSPFIVLQMTHSGRYSKPQGTPAPLIAYNNPIFEKSAPIDPSRVVSDDYLAALPARYAETARLAAQAGFDAVDIKCCHRYLMSELLSAYEREGRYGGDFAGRTRLLCETAEAVKAAAPASLMVSSRLNLYDGFPFPYGFGVTAESGLTPVLDEAKQVVTLLHERYGMPLLDFTIGNPYVNPHVNRPYDKGGYLPPEHPLEGVARMMDCVGEVRRAFPNLTVIGSGYSYLRQFAPQLAAGAVESGVCDMAGFGREAFAYPTFARDIAENGRMDPKKCCITCGKCTELMRAGSVAGCVPRDGAVYAPIYRRDVLKK